MMKFFPKGKWHFANGDFKFYPNASYNLALKFIVLTTAAAMDPNWEFVSSVTPYEVTGGVTRQVGGSPTLTITGESTVWSTNPLNFGNPTAGTSLGAVVLAYCPGADSSNLLISWFDGGADPYQLPKISTGAPFTSSPHPTQGWIILP